MTARAVCWALPLLVLTAMVSGPVLAQDETVENSCVACHSNPEFFDPEDREPALGFAKDVHAAAGLSCHDCHGGNPHTAADDMDAAMDTHFADNPYRGAPKKADVPSFCGRCHSDPVYMRNFDPDLRVDQEQEYSTSHHGQLLRAGDTRVATCIDCHGVHGILGIGNPDSPVYPTRVAETCRSCHSNRELMAAGDVESSVHPSIDPYAGWRSSVHAAALLDRGDLSAPTCNDCHGNHGAVPPGLDSIAFVCGQCHGREAELFRASKKRTLYADHNDYMEGEDSCASCHEVPEPQAELVGVHSFSECDSCHRHHAIVRPSLAILSPLPETPCALCHEGTGTLGAEFPEPAAPARNFESVRDGLIRDAGDSYQGTALFDYLVDRAQKLPFHTEVTADGETTLRPEFARLFTKFRIGKTTHPFTDPTTGEEVQVAIRRCSDCHGPEPALGEPKGYNAARTFLQGMWELTGMIARAERGLLRARRGGVETGEVQAAIDEAVDAQIELEVLVHSFDASEESPFAQKRVEGLEQARLALEGGREALGELSFRRVGLAIALAFIVLALVGLALKIRDLPAED